MSAGDFLPSIYQTNTGGLYNVRIQPETLTLTFNTVANTPASGPVPPGLPSAKVSGNRNSIGINCRKVRVRFTTTFPTGYSGGKDTISLPVLTSSAFNAWGVNDVGTYTLGGTAYDVRLIGKTPEAVN